MPYLGEIIALTTVLCWTISVQCFEAASRRVGSTPVNIIRLSVALLLFALLLAIRDGTPIPVNFPRSAWILLGLSGIVGFFIGDLFLFKALVELGPRLTMLLHSLAAPCAAVIGWLFLDESYTPHQWFGILITLSGVCLVIFERSSRTVATANKRTIRIVTVSGVLFGLGAMLGQAGGYVLSKAGMHSETGYLDAFSATQVRALSAFACFVLYFTFSRRWSRVKGALGNKRALGLTVAGSCFGPFLGVSLSLLTLQYLPTGVAATILSLVPICIIPFSIILYREQVSLRAALGTIVAILGVVMLVH